MKKISLALLMLLSTATVQTQAQTILEEDFETGATQLQSSPIARGEGWTTVNTYKGSNMTFNWHNYYKDPDGQGGPTINGAGCAACDGPITASGTVDGSGPREEILLTPELDLNDTYQLQFSWKVSPMNHQEYSKYDLQVRVVTGDNLSAAETVFSIQNEQMLRESGVTVFPIDTWDLHTSKIDLSDWKGEKVKLAFVYKMFTTSSNIVWLDDVSVKKFTPATGPVANITMDRYNFGTVYIGEKLYSQVFTLTNTGKDGLKITGMDLPKGVGTTLNVSELNLRAYDAVDFQLYYEAAMTSAAKGDAVIHTTGGDVTIAITAEKQLLPEGYQLENFNAYFPPAGWKNNGWSWTGNAIEGDHSAYSSGGFSVETLRSPRLDLSEGGKLIFTYYNQYDGDTAPEYDITVQVSYDGGDNWETKWTSDYQNGLNQLLTAEVDLGEGSDNSYIRFHYPAIESDDEGAYDHSSFTLDRVLLPNVYGADGVPGSCTYLSPANNAKEVYPKNIVLSWGPAQFAKGYKVYVGTNAEANDLIDGANVNSDLSITIPQAAYETTYRWKVVAYNDKGDATGVSTWKFTTQPDASVMEFPWEENFDNCTNDDVPSGWLSTTDNEYENRRWSPNSLFGYSNTCLYTGWMNKGRQSTLLSPEFKLPAEGQGMSISFYWGDEHPRSLVKDDTGLLKKENVEGSNGKSEVVFEIYSDGEWKQAAYLSENYISGTDTKYWRHETIDLNEYAGKTVQFRWVNRALSGAHNGASLDNVVIDGTVVDGVVFNKDGWDAGKVNYTKAVNSGEQFTMLNNGKNAQKVKSVTFATDDFQSSILVGQEIASGEGIAFNVTFTANQAGKQVEDAMTVEFESGLTASFPVRGETMAADVLYYGFEKNALDYDWKADFKQIDVDNQVTYMSRYYLTEIEDDGGRHAFVQATHHNPNLTAHSGIGTIAAVAPDNNSAADDWLISKQIIPQEGASFDFYARNLATTGSVFNGDNDLHSVEVLISEATSNKADFQTIMPSTEMSYLGENQWHHFTADLSAYAGKKVFVAVRHTTVSANWIAFFDDFTFTHVADAATGINAVQSSEFEVQSYYDVQGRKVAQPTKGLYIIKNANGKTIKAVSK